MTTNAPEALINSLWWLTFLRGTVTIVLGLCALLWPSLTIATLFALFGIFSILHDVIALVTGRVVRSSAWAGPYSRAPQGSSSACWSCASCRRLAPSS